MIYWDHHAATPVLPEALLAMRDAEKEAWANPSSVHRAGRASRAFFETARRSVAESVSADPNDIVFTSGGTEGIHLGLHGVLTGRTRARIVTTAVEHPAVAATLDGFAALGFDLVRLPVPHGRPPTPDELATALVGDVALVATQWINHETGTIFPVSDYGNLCATRGIPFFVDATQALGKIPINVSALGATVVVVAGHKMGGPAGIGAMIVRRGFNFHPTMLGGAQERGRRAGSPDVVRAVGFGVACGAVPRRIAETAELAPARDAIESGLLSLGAVVNANDGPRVASALNVSIQKKQGAIVVAALDVEGLCVSSGAACSSGVAEASPVLLRMHADEAWRAKCAVRITLGPGNSPAEVAPALEKFKLVLGRVQNLE